MHLCTCSSSRTSEAGWRCLGGLPLPPQCHHPHSRHNHPWSHHHHHPRRNHHPCYHQSEGKMLLITLQSHLSHFQEFLENPGSLEQNTLVCTNSIIIAGGDGMMMRGTMRGILSSSSQSCWWWSVSSPIYWFTSDT